MTQELARLLRKERKRRGWSLREVERRAGVHNAHLSQIEKGHIERPAMPLLYKLARLYEVDYSRLMRLAGHATDADNADARALHGAALHSLSDLSEDELRKTVDFLDQLTEERRRRQP